MPLSRARTSARWVVWRDSIVALRWLNRRCALGRLTLPKSPGTYHRQHIRGSPQEHAMTVDRKWVERNLGFDPIATPPPAVTFATARAAGKPQPEVFQREIIDFDSESP